MSQMGRLKTCTGLKLSWLLRLSQECGFCEFQIHVFKARRWGFIMCCCLTKGLLRSVWKTVTWKSAEGQSLVQIRFWSNQNGRSHCLHFPFILYASFGKMLLLTLHIFPHVSTTRHRLWRSWDVQGEMDGTGSFKSSRVCWTPTGKLALGLVGTLREKTENNKRSDW